MTQAQRDIRRKLKVLEYARDCGNIAKACRYFGISRQCYYNWLHAFEREGEAGLVDSRPCPENHKLRTPKPIQEPHVPLRPTPDRLVPRPLSRHLDLAARGPQRAREKRDQPSARQLSSALDAQCDPLREAGARTPCPGGCEVPRLRGP